MRNWLIKLLGGYTKKEWAQAYNDLGQYKTGDHFQKLEIKRLNQALREARKEADDAASPLRLALKRVTWTEGDEE